MHDDEHHVGDQEKEEKTVRWGPKEIEHQSLVLAWQDSDD
jgi:hypothetical protein